MIIISVPSFRFFSFRIDLVVAVLCFQSILFWGSLFYIIFTFMKFTNWSPLNIVITCFFRNSHGGGAGAKPTSASTLLAR